MTECRVVMFGYIVDAVRTGETKIDRHGDTLFRIKMKHTTGNMAINFTWQYEQDLIDLGL